MDKVKKFYDNRVKKEWKRLDRDRMEYEITLRVLRKYLPKTPANVCDIGSGPGRYSIFLARQGYNMTLFDLCEKNLKYAKKQAKEQKIKISNFIKGSATDISMIKSESFDAVLLVGPLYHLINLEDRKKAVSEANRILIKGGVIFASFITRFEALRFIANNDPNWAYKNSKIIEEIITRGILKNPINLNRQSFLTEMYFVDDKEIPSLMELGGFRTISLYGIEAIGGRHYEKVNLLKGKAWEWWVDLNWRFSQNPFLALTSDHLLYVGKKS